MSLIDKVTRIEKRLEGLASRRDVVRQPIEIQRAIVDEIDEHVELVGRSRRVLPFNRIGVHIVAVSRERRAALQAALSAERLEAAIRDHLREACVEIESGLEVHVRFVRVLAAGSGADKGFHLSFARVEAPVQSPGRTAVPPASARLVVLKGQAARKSFDLSATCTNIGRLAEVTDKADRVVRRNQVVYLDVPDETTRTVSRAQAHITFEPPADYRLHDDRSSYGTRVFRQGKTLEIPSGSPKGVKLKAGDEIYFGRASVRFEVTESAGKRPEGQGSGAPGTDRRGKRSR